MLEENPRIVKPDFFFSVILSYLAKAPGDRYEMIKLLLDDTGPNRVYADALGSRVLREAAWYGKEETVRVLLAHPGPHKVVPGDGYSEALTNAVRSGKAKIVQALLDYKNPGATDESDSDEESDNPLIQSVKVDPAVMDNMPLKLAIDRMMQGYERIGNASSIRDAAERTEALRRAMANCTPYARIVVLLLKEESVICAFRVNNPLVQERLFECAISPLIEEIEGFYDAFLASRAADAGEVEVTAGDLVDNLFPKSKGRCEHKLYAVVGAYLNFIRAKRTAGPQPLGRRYDELKAEIFSALNQDD